MDEARLKVFRTLKPICVEVSQLALKFKSTKTTSKSLIKSLENLYSALQVVSKQEAALDPKLAEYVFFPLSHVFRDVKDLPVRVVELALLCLQILISEGWRSSVSADMSRQLLILLCFIAGGSPTESRVKAVNEEIGTVAFECLASLFRTSGNAALASDGSIKAENAPVFGHTVSVMLDGTIEGPSIKVRLAALTSLHNMIDAVEDQEALRNVFPGIVSSLTRVLSAKSNLKPSYRVLTTALHCLRNILCKVLSDDKSLRTEDDVNIDKVPHTRGNPSACSWLDATASQVKMALANIMPLRYHERAEVQEALSQLCISILDTSRNSLRQSVGMALETLVVICSHVSTNKEAYVSNISRVLGSDFTLPEILKSSLHDWVVALPRIMQANDDTRKQRAIDQICTAYSILQTQAMSLDLLNESISTHLRASISAALEATSTKRVPAASEISTEMTQMLQPAGTTSRSESFSAILFSESGSGSTMRGLHRLVNQLRDIQSSIPLKQSTMSSLHNSSGNEQLAALWLSLQFLSSNDIDSYILDQHLSIPLTLGSQQPLLDDVYSFALSVLSKSTFEWEASSWQLQALSLEAFALQARSQKKEFRPELVDCLYPILERLGSNTALLQQHAMTCLNIVSNACQYPDPAALIVDNADYLVNAISLKLNTFEISPQAAQVLVMMVRLCGSVLIPYLDDLIESIFSILACYHGYPKLVESLFSVLNAVVEEASKSHVSLIEEGNKDTTTRPSPYKPATIADLATFLRSNHERKTRPLSPPHESPPSSPKPASTKPPPSEPSTDTSTLPAAEPSAPQPSKSHRIVSSITSLSPSHLTSPSASLRTGILTLLSTSIPILARDTDSFLPLAVQLYPYITTRLFSKQAPLPFELLAAAQALAALCHSAGDFLRQRVDESWDQVERLYWRVEGSMRDEVRSARGRTGGAWWRCWDGVVGLVLSIVRDVGVGELGKGEEGVFEILGPWVGERPRRLDEKAQKRGDGLNQRDKDYEKNMMGSERRLEVRACLEGLNADMLWLVEERARIQRGGTKMQKPEGVAGFEFVDLDMESTGVIV
ncbi:MAG: hypothetical protein Q9163_003659 [Psora crenata]